MSLKSVLVLAVDCVYYRLDAESYLVVGVQAFFNNAMR